MCVPWPNPIRNFCVTSVGKIPKHSKLVGNNCDAYLRLKVNDAKLPNFYCKEKTHEHTHTHTHTPSSSIYEEKKNKWKGKRRKDLIKSFKVFTLISSTLAHSI